ncbi:hypothetical protein HC256_002880 [Beauveria bassiana]|nr:hypothetical protein HC256_002880 [Beauveria bassiana]
MVYDWDTHQETCYQLYIQEGRSLEDIMEYLKAAHEFCPSKRAFQTQFRRWNFPAKQRPAHKNDRLVARIKELWEKNLAQREMLRILNEEDGYDIKPRELMRVRTKNRWLLRVPNSTVDATLVLPDGGHNDDHDGTDDDSEERGEHIDLDYSVATSHDNNDMTMQESDSGNGTPVTAPGGSRSRRRRRQSGQDVQSTTASGNNRFPSEMTIDEARDILSLDTTTYRTLRTNFKQICNEDSLSRKTEAGPERWAAAKQRLIGSSLALQRMLWVNSTVTGGDLGGSTHSFDQRQLALDVICTDVTKRLRTLETRMTLGEAKAVLGVNPTESRDMRAALHTVLLEARFVSKSDATPQQWEGLKQQWGQRAPVVQAILENVSGTEEAKTKMRALEMVASDVMKRLRDQRRSRQSLAGTSRSSHRQEMQAVSSTTHSSPNTAAGQMELAESLAGSNFDDLSEVPQMTFDSPGSDAMHMPLTLSQASSLTVDGSQQSGRGVLSTMNAAMQLNSPGMGGPGVLLSPGSQAAFLGHHHQPFYSATAVAAASSASVASASPQMYPQPPCTSSRGGGGGGGAGPDVPACAVYLRLHPSSSFITEMSLWVATLGSHSVQELRESAVARFPGAACIRVEGVIKDGKGGELPLQIEHEQELAAYLAHMQGASPTFNVQLVWKDT